MTASDGLTAEKLVRGLLARQAESRSLDYKGAMSFGPTKQVQAKILKWIMAFSNSRDGGYILIGVGQKAGKFIAEGVDDAQASSFDVTNIGTFAKNYCSVLPNVSTQVVPVDGVNLLLLTVREFVDEPIVCITDCHDASQKLILQAGSIYIRTSDARSAAIQSSEDMRGLLDLAVEKRGEALLRQIGRLVGSTPQVSSGKPAGPYETELAGAYKFFEAQKLTEPYWHVEVLPVSYVEDRVRPNAKLKEIRRETVVSVRGWDFPHIDHEHDQSFEHGIQSHIAWNRHHEAHRFYKSGLFAWRRRLSEDFGEEYKGALSYVSSIYSLTEFLIFAGRYASKIMDDGKVMIRLGIVGLDGRPLRMDARGFHDEYSTGAQGFSRVYEVPVEELRASHMEIASVAARDLFDQYDLDVSPDVITDWQKKLIERRF